MVFGLSRTAAVSNLVPLANISMFASDAVTTVLLNCDTGERVPHWTERDAFHLNFGPHEPPLLLLQVMHFGGSLSRAALSRRRRRGGVCLAHTTAKRT
jgi:hypothetical protein